MSASRGAHKVDYVTVTLVPTADERSFRHVPSTFSPVNRSYEWRHGQQLDYLIVPKKVSSNEIQVELFFEGTRKGRQSSRDVQKTLQDFVRGKIESEWAGLRLASIGRPGVAVPPQKTFVRGTIEEMLGANLEM